LAIELAAARLKLLDVGQIAARLDDSLQLLSRGSAGAAPRHQTMRAAIDWSYVLLSQRERRLFRRLAVFSGSFTLESVEAICTDGAAALATDVDRVPVSGALNALADLADKSLVVIEERTAGDAVRYRLLEPIRQYALDRLREAGEETAMQDRHLDHFLSFAEQAEPELKSANQLQWLRRLDKEQANLRAALAWSRLDADRDIAGLRLAKALHLFWQRRGYWSEGRRELELAIAHHDARASSPAAGGPFHLARVIVALSWLAVYLQDYGDTREHLERGLALAQAADDFVTTAHALGLLSFLNSYAGNLPAAEEFAAASVASARQADDPWTLAWALHVFGRNLYAIGQEQAGRAALEESEALYRKTGDQRSLAVHINNEAIIAENAGELDRSRTLFEEVLAIGQALEDNDLQVKALGNLASLVLMQGDIQRAEELYEQAITQVRSLGEHLTLGSHLTGLARIRMLQGDFETAEQYLHESLAWARKMGHQAWLALALAGLGRIQAERGQARQAARLWGAIDVVLQRKLDADDRYAVEQWETVVRAALPPEEFSAAFIAGQALSLEEAVQEILGSAQEVDRLVPQPAAAMHQLQVHALGPTRVVVGRQPLTSWPYARVKELLFYLASYPARTKAQIGLALWPDAAPKQLRNSLSTTLYHLRRTLDDPQWILFEDELYRFNRALDYSFDVEVFEANLAQASRNRARTPDRAIALLQDAIALYRGDFLEDFLEGEWFLLRREELRRKYLDALLNLGQLLGARGDYAHAAECYRRAIEKDEVLEEAHRELMRCYARLGERGQALRHYQTLEQLMRDELGSAPAAESVTLFQRLKRGEEV
jgi:DNA-binding SARP family transcriptional activator